MCGCQKKGAAASGSTSATVVATQTSAQSSTPQPVSANTLQQQYEAVLEDKGPDELYSLETLLTRRVRITFS